MNDYITAEKIVRMGQSKIFENWKSVGVDMEDFLREIKWLYDDPKQDFGNGKVRMTRELGCTKSGELIRLKRANDVNGDFIGFYEIATGLFWRQGPSISCADSLV